MKNWSELAGVGVKQRLRGRFEPVEEAGEVAGGVLWVVFDRVAELREAGVPDEWTREFMEIVNHGME